jgi:hypothetical protein
MRREESVGAKWSRFSAVRIQALALNKTSFISIIRLAVRLFRRGGVRGRRGCCASTLGCENKDVAVS